MAREPSWSVAVAARTTLVGLIGLAALVGACGRDKPASPSKAASSAPPSTPPLASKAYYRVDPGPRTSCTAGAVCEARLALTALGDYHINKDYPFRFVGDPAPAVPLEGDGAFVLDDERNGMMTVKFKAGEPGTAKLAGTFKLSVCSDDKCEIEAPTVALEVAVR
jgi:hypothetical protein